MDIKQKLTKNLQSQLKKQISLEIPPSLQLGDYALHCYKLKSNPEEIQKLLKLPRFIEKTEINGPYINFFIDKSYLAKQTLTRILKEKDKYGTNNTGKNKKALVEHTSINPNAPSHVGRARNAIIGDSIVRLLKFERYKTETHYYVNDIGKQIAMLVLACKNKKPSFAQLLNLYIDFNKKLKKSPELEKEVFSTLHSLEKGDKKILSQFKQIVSICIKGQIKILSELGIKYDLFDYESKFLFNKDTETILKKLEKTKRLFIDEQGRKTLNLSGMELPMKAPYLPLTRSDKTSMYILRDIAYAVYKEKRGKDRNIWLLGEDHKLYSQQMKAILSILKQKSPEVVYYSFVLLPSGKMSTRRGEVVLLEQFMEEMLNKTAQELTKRHGKMQNLNKLAKIIAYGALKFTILKVSPDKNITFNIEKALSFEGESAPYIQYAYTRANSILKKVKTTKKLDYSALKTDHEQSLIKKLAEFPQVVKTTSKTLHPHIIANYSLDLAKIFNEFYHECQVTNQEESLKNARIKLVKATKITLKNALSILGIDCPEFM